MEDAVRRALELAPGSIRALAQEAGISPRLLRMIRDGERTATPRVVAALASACDRMADHSAAAARVLRESLSKEES
jgi:hypothetical protein